MYCPNCGSDDVRAIPVTSTTTRTDTKGFDGCNACCGYLLFGWIGILCGMCGMGEGKQVTTHHTEVVNVCQKCGKQF